MMSRLAYREACAVSFDSGEPGGCQKLDQSCGSGRVSAHTACLCRRSEPHQGRLDGTYRLVNARAWTYDVRAPEVLVCGLEHALEIGPFADVGALEDRLCGGARGAGVVGDEFLGFGAESEVCEDDVAVLAEEEAGEGEVDA